VFKIANSINHTCGRKTKGHWWSCVGGMNLAIMLLFVTIMTIMYKVKSQVSTFCTQKIKAKKLNPKSEWTQRVHFHESNPPTIFTTIYWEHILVWCFQLFPQFYVGVLMEVVNVASASKSKCLFFLTQTLKPTDTCQSSGSMNPLFTCKVLNPQLFGWPLIK